jgi:hypothetical protein
MSRPAPPPLPADRPDHFRTTVHGTVFCDRSRALEQVRAGDELLLIPGPPTDDEPGVWVHVPGGEVIGHLPPEIEKWLTPWMLRGGSATARAVRVRGADTPSFRRLLIEVRLAA